MIALQIKDVNFSYDAARIIDGVSLSLKQGEFLGIIGPNGAGKSTLLRLICGICKPADGEIMLFEKPLAGQNQKEIARQVGFVPQETHFTLNFTVEDVVMMGRYPYQQPFMREKREDIDAQENAITAANIEQLRKRPVNSLSSGERQRVVIARALAQVPRLLVLDEPTSHLDLHHQHSIMELLKRLNADGLTVVVVHHDLNLASLYCRRLLLMHSGKIEATGTPNELIKKEILSKVYGTAVRIVRHPDKDVPQIFLHTD
ncbi:MAG: heme ABC transporter ATP-binding protein [candidate division WOR-3 bacterium]|nr:MAG: heme ABC transporter ATP-binding protein [candidate division WOR-3 bacterium]